MGHHHDDYDPLIPVIRVVMIMMPMITRLTCRQGLVHLSNLLASPRVDLKYIVEADTKRSPTLTRTFVRMDNVKS